MFQEFIEYAYSTKITLVLIEILQLAGVILENLQDYEKSLYFFNQLRIICNNSHRDYDKYKIKAFIGIQNACQYFQKYEDAIKICKKALQYAWSIHSIDFEIQIYDKLSMCYFYLGMLEKSHFYHERALNHDYEIEQSPLRQMGIDSIRIYLEKNYPQNVGKHIGIPLMNCLSLHVPNEQIHVPVPEFEILFISQDRKDSTNRKSRRSISPLKKQQNSQSPLNKKSVFKRIFNGKEILEQILEEKEFEFEIYTPKHSFRSEALSFMKIKEEKFRKEIFVNKRLIAKSFSINDLGIIPNAPTLSRIENPMKYKLPLEKQIEIRLRKNYDLGSTITRIHQRVTFHQTELSRRNDKICINHKNIQREKEDLLKGRKKQIRNIQEALNGYISSLMQIGSDPKYLQ